MIKLKKLTIDTIEPSVTQKGQIAFSFNDYYICENRIGGIYMLNNEPSINSNWAQKEIVNYCISNNLQLCIIHTTGMPDYGNIVVDETVKELLKSL